MEPVAEQSFTYDGLNRWNGPISLYNYDAAGNLISSGTSDIGGHSFTYNALSQVVTVDAGATASYIYNGSDERVFKQTATGWTAYTHFDGQPSEEFDSTGAWTDYIYAGSQRVAKITTPPSGPAVLNYYLDDHPGTTQVELDASGNVTWQGQFTPFGAELPDGSTDMHYKYTGKERDSESGLDYFGARYYGSAMGRWVSPDWSEKPEEVPYSSLSDPQSLNLYSYVNNNPLNGTDPDGHNRFTDWVKSKAASVKGWWNANHSGFTDDQDRQMREQYSLTNPEYLGNAMLGASVAAVATSAGGEEGEEGEEAEGIATVSTRPATDATADAARAAAELEEPSGPYVRPNNATTPEQRQSVQGKPCATCGATGQKNNADHTDPLVEQHYRGGIDKSKMQSKDAVRPQCQSCSAQQGGYLSGFSRAMKKLFGFDKK